MYSCAYICTMAKKKTEAEVIGENIRRMRELKHLSQKELAASIGAAPTQYSRVETGKVIPSLKTLMGVAKALDTSLDSLVNANGSASQEVTIKDKSLFDKVQLIDSLPEDEKGAVLKVIELAMNKKKFKELLKEMQ